jgi:hypothetical protein
LSVGRAVLTTMAREGIGRTYRLADFDRLELSNMNRLHAAVHDLGIPKVVLAAREILEMDPYIDVKIFPTGLNESNLHEFMDIDGRIDLLIEECDDLFAKVLIREQARNRGIPVLMSTSDRGLIDVERFDREPERPVFHNLLSGVDAKTLQTLSTKDKVPYVLDTLGSDLVSDRMLSSLLEVGETLVTWPQLASSVALGGAVIADVARRILLGQMNASGRFYVDVAELVSDSTAWTPECPDRSGQNAMNWTGDSEIIHGASAAIVPQASGQLSQEEIRTLVSYAVSAPSGGNSQPWRFVARGSELDCYRDTTRSGSVLDFRGWFSNLAIGAAIENLHLAAAAMGIQTWGEMSRGNL